MVTALPPMVHWPLATSWMTTQVTPRAGSPTTLAKASVMRSAIVCFYSGVSTFSMTFTSMIGISNSCDCWRCGPARRTYRRGADFDPVHGLNRRVLWPGVVARGAPDPSRAGLGGGLDRFRGLSQDGSVLALILYLAAINAVTAAVWAWDKHQAVRGGWRVRERTLLWLVFIGGTPAALWVRVATRHKTSKRVFATRLWIVVALQVFVTACLVVVVNFRV